MKFLDHDLQDKNFLRYVVRSLKAGILEDNEQLTSEWGSHFTEICQRLPVAKLMLKPNNVHVHRTEWKNL